MASKFVSTSRSPRETVTRGNVWVKPTDQMDLWLDSQGYYRKHTAKDGSCLYRAVSEQIFLAQAFHLDVRRQCADYAKRHPELLSSIIHCSINEYVEQMKHPHEAGGKLELEILSRMYRKDFLVFQDVGKSYQTVTNNGFKDHLMLCLSQDRHYDSVYTKQFISNAAFCQSIVYEMLYKGVFQLLEVDYAVKKMLHDKSSKYQRDPSSFLMNGLALRLEIRDTYVNVKDLLNLGVTPFPYKVAKSLDPDIYRNVEYDTWNDIRRGMRFGMFLWNNRELQVGVKCLVKLDSERTCHAHIQEMAPNKGPVLVFVEEHGEKMSVPYESLELLPQSPPPQSPLPFPLKQFRQLHTIKALNNNSEDIHITDTANKDHMLDPYPEQRSDKDSLWPCDMEVDGRCTPSLKNVAELPKPTKRPSKSYRAKTKDLQLNISEPNKNLGEMNSIVSSSDCNYQQRDVMGYQHEQSEECNSQSYVHQVSKDQHMEEGQASHRGQDLRPCAPAVVPCIDTQTYYVPNVEGYAHPTFCYMPHKSVLPDGSDLPLADMATLRFYYNYGVDYSRGVRPAPPCYYNNAVAYLPDQNVSPVVYEHASPISTPDSAVVMSPVGVYPAQRPDSLPVLPSPGGVSLSSEPDSTTFNVNMQNMAPRFKNKIRASQSRHCDSSVIQQPEVSSTTNIPMPTHYIAPPVFYHPVECEAYCPANYVEYSVYDPAVFYPGTHPVAPPLPTHPPTHFITPDASFYQHVVAAPLPSMV